MIGELYKRYKKGDNDAILEIIDNFKPLIFKESRKWKIKCYDYEDLVQHGYLSIIKALNIFKGEPEKFVGYCIKAIKMNYRALLKGEIKHHREIPDEYILDKADNDYLFTLEDEVIAYEKTKELYNALDKLSESEKHIIKEAYFNNNLVNKIALDSNLTYNKVRYKKFKALKKLQKELKVHI